MKYLVLIPARGGSKRLPGKNICLLNGVPLLAYSIQYAQRELPGSNIYVSTDNEEIASVARQYGAGVVWRPEALSGDHCPTAPVLEQAARQLVSEGEVFDYVVLLQATNPLRPEGMMREADQILSAGVFDSLFTVSSSDRKLGKIIEGRYTPWNYTLGMRSQDMNPLYYENGLLYIAHRELILQGRLQGDTLYPLVVDHLYGTVDIDTKDDLALAEYLVLQAAHQLV